MKLNLPLLAISMLILSSSCVSFTPIDQISNLKDVDVAIYKDIHRETLAEPTALEPGQTYIIAVKYLARNYINPAIGPMSNPQSPQTVDEWRFLENYKGITFEVDNNLYTIDGQKLIIAADPFLVLTKEQATLTTTFPPKIEKTIIKTLSLEIAHALPSFAGADGYNTYRINGYAYSRPSSGYGQDGQDGQTPEFEIARYDTKGTALENIGPVLLVYERRSALVWLIDTKGGRLIINANGGNGEKGGRGEDRKALEGQTRVYGGDGYPGGRGGRGGEVTIFLSPDSQLRNQILVNVQGGKGGEGGDGGSGEDNTKNKTFLDIIFTNTNGKNGQQGPNGVPGRVHYETLELNSMFSTVSSPLFNRDQLLP